MRRNISNSIQTTSWLFQLSNLSLELFAKTVLPLAMFDLTCLIDKNATQENKPNDIC